MKLRKWFATRRQMARQITILNQRLQMSRASVRRQSERRRKQRQRSDHLQEQVKEYRARMLREHERRVNLSAQLEQLREAVSPFLKIPIPLYSPAILSPIRKDDLERLHALVERRPSDDP